jgi:signal transduction histidine kinase
VLLSATALPDGDGRFLESRASVFDVSRRKAAEEEARRYAQRLKGMARRAAEAQEAERRALGRELHDRVGQNLTALNINLNILKGALPAATAAALRTRLDDSLALVDRTVESMRNVMTELRPAVLDDYGLAAMLHWYADEFGRRTGMSIRVSGDDPSPRLAAAVERTLFRIAQESLTNVAKHAGARNVELRLEPGAGSFRLSVIDDGRGFDPDALEQAGNHHGWGLMIMRERAEAVGGAMRVESRAGQGAQVTVEVAV